MCLPKQFEGFLASATQCGLRLTRHYNILLTVSQVAMKLTETQLDPNSISAIRFTLAAAIFLPGQLLLSNPGVVPLLC